MQSITLRDVNKRTIIPGNHKVAGPVKANSVHEIINIIDEIYLAISYGEEESDISITYDSEMWALVKHTSKA